MYIHLNPCFAIIINIQGRAKIIYFKVIFAYDLAMILIKKLFTLIIFRKSKNILMNDLDHNLIIKYYNHQVFMCIYGLGKKLITQWHFIAF